MAHAHHDHSGHHHEHAHQLTSLNGIYYLSIALNLAFVGVEAGVGIWSDSLGLISDAGHNLSDVFSLILALIAFKLAASHSTRRLTYGYKKSSVLISLLNAVILLIAVGAIVVESIHKFSDPAPVNGGAVAWTAGIGILINGFTAWLLMRQQKHDINTRGAYLHMAADTLVSVGVLISGIIISLTGWTVVDPVISLVIAAVILISTWELLSESLRMSIDAVPESIDIEEIGELIASQEGVKSYHHMHIWPISTTETALTVHVVVDDLAKSEAVCGAIRHHLEEENITHATIEVETPGSSCSGGSCC